VVAVVAVVAAGSAVTEIEADVVVADPIADITPVANEVGRAWASELVQAFRADEREIIGAWPGTMSEARSRVLARVGRTVAPSVLDELAKIARCVAQQRWQQISQPDPEA